MSPRRPGKSAKKDFDMERMYQKLVPSMQLEDSPVRDVEPEQLEDVPVSESIQPVNLMRYILLEKMDHTMKMLRACDCERCRGDILALALNQLPACYAVDESMFEDRTAELRRQYEVKVTSALIMAVQKVKSKPHH